MKLTREQKAIAVDMAYEGKKLEDIRLAVGCHKVREFWQAVTEDLEFGREFALARDQGLEELADSLITIADDYEDVFRARLKADCLRWLLGKRKPRVYGDKVEVNITQTVDINAALTEAKSRALLTDSSPTPEIEAEHRVIKEELPINDTDSQSVTPEKVTPKHSWKLGKPVKLRKHASKKT